jgi:hypothetical protein
MTRLAAFAAGFAAAWWWARRNDWRHNPDAALAEWAATAPRAIP